MKKLNEMPTKELVATLAGAVARKDLKFNGKVYNGVIYVQNEKINVSPEFETLWNKAQEIKDTDEYMDVVFDTEWDDDASKVNYILERL